MTKLTALLFLALILPCSQALTSITTSNDRSSSRILPDTTGIIEPACIDAAQRMQRVSVPISADVSETGQVDISYVAWKNSNKKKASVPPLILIHGFDSSCLEYRRLGPQLAAHGVQVYAVDLLGWGFSQLENIQTFSAAAKVQALCSFVATVLGEGKPFCVAGASLGGAAAIEVAALNKNCQGLVLLDAQGFVDGIGPMSMLPKPLAKLGVNVLKSVPLRSSANQMSYYDKTTYATDEAVTIGRLHCLQEGWSDALVSFMQSGGFAPSAKVATIGVPSLVVWGRQDEILDGKEFANKFAETLPDVELQWIEKCGHVPHLEQPEQTAEAIAVFLKERTSRATGSSFLPDTIGVPAPVYGLVGATALAAALASDWLPLH